MSTTTPHNTFPLAFDLLSLNWPDGTPALDALSGAFPPGRTGLVGRNGSGKSTLLRLLAGELAPTGGVLRAAADVAYLPQQLTLDTDLPVTALLGVDAKIAALRAIEGGSIDPADYETLGDDWDIDVRAEAALRNLGLDEAMLTRTVGGLSGGEAMLVAVAGLRLGGAPIVLLDEPSNNLDRDAREKLTALVSSWRGTLVLASHDEELLEHVDQITELRRGEISLTGGGYSLYLEQLQREQNAAAQALRSAEGALKSEQRDRREAEAKIAGSLRAGKKAQANKRAPKILMNGQKARAQVSAGKLRGEHDARLADARDAVERAEGRVRDDASIRIQLPDPDVATSRRLATLELPVESGGLRPVVLMGPERIALTGPNGSGKTTLLDAIAASAQALGGGGVDGGAGADAAEGTVRVSTRGGAWVEASTSASATCVSASTDSTTRRACSRTCSDRPPRQPCRNCARSSPASCSEAPSSTGPSRRSPAGSASGSRSCGSCSRPRPRSSCSSTSPPTTSTGSRPRNSSTRCATTGALCSS